MLCTLPPLMSYSLDLSSTMMSCTVHSPTDSLTQPTCILVYIECNPTPGGSPFELSLGLHSNSWVLFLPSPQSLVVWWFVLGLPWVASLSPVLSRKWPSTAPRMAFKVFSSIPRKAVLLSIPADVSLQNRKVSTLPSSRCCTCQFWIYCQSIVRSWCTHMELQYPQAE